MRGMWLVLEKRGSSIGVRGGVSPVGDDRVARVCNVMRMIAARLVSACHFQMALTRSVQRPEDVAAIALSGIPLGVRRYLDRPGNTLRYSTRNRVRSAGSTFSWFTTRWISASSAIEMAASA